MKRLITMTTIAALGLGVASAHASVTEQVPKEGDSTPTSTGNPSGCVLPTWTKQPRIVIHTAQFNRGGAAAGDEAKMVDAIEQVADQFSDTPDLSARITSVTTTTAPYYWDTWVNDSVPTIHVRFSPQSAITEDNHGDPAGGLTKTNANGGCTISEAHIEFPQPTDANWNYGTPNEAGERWYDTGETFGGDTWFRPSFLHEMLHAFGFNHVQSIYSFMNHRFPAGFPWAGGGDDGVRMLPWELGTLRDAYGDSGASYAVGLRNGWVAPPQPDDNAGSQIALCPDSSVWDDNANACKTSSEKGPRQICAGDKINGSVAVANYSTNTVSATLRMYFSKDETWDPDDIASPTTYTKDIKPAVALKLGGDWTVPQGPFAGADYFAIARVEAVPQVSGAPTQHDSIPLRIPVGKDGKDRQYHDPGVDVCGLQGTQSTPIDPSSSSPVPALG